MLIKFFILFIVFIILGCIVKYTESFYLFQGNSCSMYPQASCNPEINPGCRWINGYCQDINKDSGKSKSSYRYPPQCLQMPNFILFYLKSNNIQESNPIVNTLCSLPREIIDSIDNTGLSDEEKVNDALCASYNLMGGQGACDSTRCFFNSNINGSCRSLAAQNFLLGIQQQFTPNIPPAITQPLTETQAVNIPTAVVAPTQEVRVEIEQKYSDEDCKTLKDRGFDVHCTFNDDRDEESAFHLDRALNTQKKRIVFFDN